MRKTVLGSAAFLRGELERGRWQSGEKLPNLAQLGSIVGLSRNSMCKVVAILKREKLVTAREGGRIVAGNGDELQQDVPLKPLWRRLRHLLLADINNGHFRNGQELPTIGDLQSRFGASYAPVRRALDSLCRDGILVPSGRTFRTRDVAPFRQTNTVVVINSGRSIDRVDLGFFRTKQIIMSLEEEGSRRELKIESIGCEFHSPAMNRELEDALRKIPNVLGFIVRTGTSVDATVQENIVGILTLLLKYQKRIALFDESAEILVPESIVSAGLVKCFRLGSRTAGTAVAQHLLREGHKRIAYISLLHNQRWSVERLLGLQSIYREVPGLGVVPFVCDTAQDHDYLAVSQIKLDRESLGTLFSVGMAEERARAFLRHHDTLQKAAPSEKALFEEEAEALLPVYETLASVARNRPVPNWLTSVRYMIWRETFSIAMKSMCYPMFEQAFADPSITAWVTMSDRIAAHAMSFLSEKSGNARKTAIVSYDNSDLSVLNRVTSYDFSSSAIAHNLIGYVIGREPGNRRGRKHETQEIEGVLIKRRDSPQGPAQWQY